MSNSEWIHIIKALRSIANQLNDLAILIETMLTTESYNIDDEIDF